MGAEAWCGARLPWGQKGPPPRPTLTSAGCVLSTGRGGVEVGSHLTRSIRGGVERMDLGGAGHSCDRFRAAMKNTN